jgi:cell division transport system permease protein
MIFYLRYFTIRALQNMRGTLLPNLTTIGIIAITMLIFSSFSLIAFNLSSFLKIWEDKIEVIVYLRGGVSSDQVETLLKKTRRFEGVDRVKYVSSADAMTFMEMKLGEQKTVLDGIPPGTLPPSFEIQLVEDYRNLTRIRDLVSRLKEFPEIEEIQYGQEWVEAFSVIGRMVRLTQWILGGLLLAAMIFIISNTLQLTISFRRDEIEIMHLVGARPSFIQVPFYIEGLIQSLLGTGLALLLLFSLHKVILLYLTPSMKGWLAGISISFLPLRNIAGMVFGGIVLGFFGSFIASMKILKYGG